MSNDPFDPVSPHEMSAPPPTAPPPIHSKPAKSSLGLVLAATALSLAGLLIVGVFVVQKVIEAAISENLTTAAAKNRDAGAFSHKNVRVSLLNRSIRINGIKIESKKADETFSVDQLSISELDTATFLKLLAGAKIIIPSHARLGFKGLHLTPAMLGSKAEKEMSELGYDELAVSASVGISINRELKSFAFDNLTVEIANAGRLSASAAFEGVAIPSEEELANLKEKDMMKSENAMKLASAALKSFEVRYDDLSLISRIDKYGQSKGQPSFAVAAQSLSSRRGRGPASASPFMGDAIAKIQKFAEKPTSISLKANPPQPLPMSEMGMSALFDPEGFANQLHLSLEVGE